MSRGFHERVFLHACQGLRLRQRLAKAVEQAGSVEKCAIQPHGTREEYGGMTHGDGALPAACLTIPPTPPPPPAMPPVIPIIPDCEAPIAMLFIPPPNPIWLLPHPCSERTAVRRSGQATPLFTSFLSSRSLSPLRATSKYALGPRVPAYCHHQVSTRPGKQHLDPLFPPQTLPEGQPWLNGEDCSPKRQKRKSKWAFTIFLSRSQKFVGVVSSPSDF